MLLPQVAAVLKEVLKEALKEVLKEVNSSLYAGGWS